MHWRCCRRPNIRAESGSAACEYANIDTIRYCLTRIDIDIFLYPDGVRDVGREAKDHARAHRLDRRGSNRDDYQRPLISRTKGASEEVGVEEERRPDESRNAQDEVAGGFRALVRVRGRGQSAECR